MGLVGKIYMTIENLLDNISVKKSIATSTSFKGFAVRELTLKTCSSQKISAITVPFHSPR